MRLMLVGALLMTCFCINPVSEDLSNRSSLCVLSMNDNKILKTSNQNYTQSVASISKIMTAIIAIEKGKLNEKIIVDESIENVEGSMLYLKKGEVYTLKDLLYGLMLRSGNDAAVLIANHIAGSIDDFVFLMNQKAKELGMDLTHFSNPSGLDDDGGNVSSSCDMALLMSYAMKNEKFYKITSSKTYSPNETKLWKNKNRFLFSYPYATGGKTGFTKKARRTLVTTSKKDNLEIVVVTLRMSNDFEIHENLHEQYLYAYEAKKIIEKGKYQIGRHKVKINEPIFITSKKDKDIQIDIEGKYQDNKYILYIDDMKKKRKMVFAYE